MPLGTKFQLPYIYFAKFDSYTAATYLLVRSLRFHCICTKLSSPPCVIMCNHVWSCVLSLLSCLVLWCCLVVLSLGHHVWSCRLSSHCLVYVCCQVCCHESSVVRLSDRSAAGTTCGLHISEKARGQVCPKHHKREFSQPISSTNKFYHDFGLNS